MKYLYELLLKVGTNPQLKAWAAKQLINLKHLKPRYKDSFQHILDKNKVKDILDPKWLDKEYAAKKAYNLKNKVLDITKAKDKIEWLKDQAALNKAKFHGKNFKGWVDDSVKKIGDDFDNFIKKDAAQSKWFNDTLGKYLKGDKKATIEIDKYFKNIEKINKEKVVPFWPRKKPYKVHKAEGGIAELLGEPRSGYQDGGRGYQEYWTTVQDSFSEAGGEEGTGMNIHEFADIYFPRKAQGGRIGLAEGDTPSQAWMRDYFYSSGYDDLGVITLDEYINGPRGWKDYMEYGPGAS